MRNLWRALGRIFLRYAVWRILIALLLLTAAGLKAHVLTTQSILEREFWNTRPFLTILALVEVGLAFWVIVGLYARWTRLAVCLLFFCFFEFSLYLALSGKGNCPCFGTVKINPWWTMLLDLVVFAGLSRCTVPREGPTATSAPARLCLFSLAFLLVAFPVVAAIVNYAPRGVIYYLRRDPRLQQRVAAELVNPRTYEVLKELEKSTGLAMTLDGRLQSLDPDFGVLNLNYVPAWSVMEMTAERQPLPARWDPTENGFILVSPSSFWSALAPWCISAAVLLVVFGGVGSTRFSACQGQVLAVNVLNAKGEARARPRAHVPLGKTTNTETPFH